MELIKFNEYEASFNLRHFEDKEQHVKRQQKPVVDTPT